jgi:UDP-glucuronate 4-epimerase
MYAATKRMNELMCHCYHHLYGLRISLFRFFTVYGPRQRPDMAIHKFTRLIHEGRPVPMFGDGATARDYTYIDDILDGLVRAVDRPFDYEIFNLGEHHTTELRRLIELISQAVGKPARIEPKPMQPGDVTLTYASIDKARRLLGYAPATNVEDGIPRFVEWYQQQYVAG